MGEHPPRRCGPAGFSQNAGRGVPEGRLAGACLLFDEQSLSFGAPDAAAQSGGGDEASHGFDSIAGQSARGLGALQDASRTRGPPPFAPASWSAPAPSAPYTHLAAQIRGRFGNPKGIVAQSPGLPRKPSGLPWVRVQTKSPTALRIGVNLICLLP